MVMERTNTICHVRLLDNLCLYEECSPINTKRYCFDRGPAKQVPIIKHTKITGIISVQAATRGGRGRGRGRVGGGVGVSESHRIFERS
jgi:hypothetical protein